MFTTTIRLAEKVIRIHSIHSQIVRLCKDYAVEAEEVDFEITITQQDIDREAEPMERYSDGYLETLAVYRKICDRLLDYDTILMHGSVVAIGDTAYMFTAPSGTGKTTHSRLWLENIPGAYILNGDKPLLHITDTGVTAYGTPYRGKENYGVNGSANLKAICILARGETNRIEHVSAGSVLPELLRQIHLAGDVRVIRLLQKLTRNVAFYKLHCNIAPEAALLSFKRMVQPESTGSIDIAGKV